MAGWALKGGRWVCELSIQVGADGVFGKWMTRPFRDLGGLRTPVAAIHLPDEDPTPFREKSAYWFSPVDDI